MPLEVIYADQGPIMNKYRDPQQYSKSSMLGSPLYDAAALHHSTNIPPAHHMSGPLGPTYGDGLPYYPSHAHMQRPGYSRFSGSMGYSQPRHAPAAKMSPVHLHGARGWAHSQGPAEPFSPMLQKSENHTGLFASQHGDLYHSTPQSPQPASGSRPRVSDYAGSAEFGPNFSVPDRIGTPSTYPYHRSMDYSHAQRHVAPRQYSTGMTPPPSVYAMQHMGGNPRSRLPPPMNFSGKFSITPDPGSIQNDDWVASRHLDRLPRDPRDSSHPRHVMMSGPLLPGGTPPVFFSSVHDPHDMPRQLLSHYPSHAADLMAGRGGVYPRGAYPRAGMTSPLHGGIVPGLRESEDRPEAAGTADGNAPSQRHSVLPDDFQQAYEETVREMDAMDVAFREALSVYGDDVAELTTFDLEEHKSACPGAVGEVEKKVPPEAAMQPRYRNESAPNLGGMVGQPHPAFLYSTVGADLPSGREGGVWLGNPQHVDGMVGSGTAMAQASAVEVAPEVDNEYEAEMSANNAKVLDWLATI